MKKYSVTWWENGFLKHSVFECHNIYDLLGFNIHADDHNNIQSIILIEDEK